MKIADIKEMLEKNPVIAATDKNWENAVNSEADVLFHLGANILSIEKEIKAAKQNGKTVFVHIDLAEGIGKDKTGVTFLASIGADGIISTRTSLIRAAKENGLLAVQRFFVLDTNGLNSINEVIDLTKPDLIEIMPGVVPKAIKLFSKDNNVIAGGLIETKREITDALSAGAIAVSTGKEKLWNE